MDPHVPIPREVDPPRRAWNPPKAALSGLAAIVLLLSGCSQPGPFMQRQTMMGAMKTNVAQLESEKEQLAKELSEQKAATRRIETQLAEVESQNGDLAVRLDDARALLSRQGIDGRSSRSASDSELDRPAPRRA